MISLAAILFGGLVVTQQKGTWLHRIIGRLYFLSMALMNVTALLIYDLFGYFGPFHFFALISLATITAGLVPVLRKRPHGNWLFLHAEFMNWSYVGLLAAAVSEITTRLFYFPFGMTVFVSSLIVFIIGGTMIKIAIPGSIIQMSARK